MNHLKPSVPRNLFDFFEDMKSLSRDMAFRISRHKSADGSYWHDIDQSIQHLQEFLASFSGKIENLTLDELSCRVICSFEDYTQKFIDRKEIFISNSSHKTKSEEYAEVTLRANNTALFLEETSEKLQTRFEQLIYKKVAAKKSVTEGTEHC